MDFHAAAHRLDGAGELGEQAVAGRLDDPAAMRGDGRIDELTSVRIQVAKRAFLVFAHQSAVAGNVGCEHSGQATFHLLAPPVGRRRVRDCDTRPRPR